GQALRAAAGRAPTGGGARHAQSASAASPMARATPPASAARVASGGASRTGEAFGRVLRGIHAVAPAGPAYRYSARAAGRCQGPAATFRDARTARDLRLQSRAQPAPPGGDLVRADP